MLGRTRCCVCARAKHCGRPLRATTPRGAKASSGDCRKPISPQCNADDVTFITVHGVQRCWELTHNAHVLPGQLCTHTFLEDQAQKEVDHSLQHSGGTKASRKVLCFTETIHPELSRLTSQTTAQTQQPDKHKHRGRAELAAGPSCVARKTLFTFGQACATGP
jgi:hypothetical protein